MMRRYKLLELLTEDECKNNLLIYIYIYMGITYTYVESNSDAQNLIQKCLTYNYVTHTFCY